MAEFTIDGATYETDNLDDTQKRVIAPKNWFSPPRLSDK